VTELWSRSAGHHNLFLTGYTLQKTNAAVKIQALWYMTSLTDIL